MKLNDVTPEQWDAVNKNEWVDTGKIIDSEEAVKRYSRLNKSALDIQHGGSHYKKFAIQPAEFCHKNKIPYLEATAIKYLCRWRDKGGKEDLDKAIHFIEMLKEFEFANT